MAHRITDPDELDTDLSNGTSSGGNGFGMVVLIIVIFVILSYYGVI